MATYVRDTRCKVEIQWEDGGSWIDESAYTMSVSGQHRLAPPEESITATQGQVARCVITLRNDGRFSVLNTSSAITAYISNGLYLYRNARVSISIDGGSTYEYVFVGVIKSMSETTIHPNNTPVAVLDCRGLEEKYLNDRQSTLQSTFKSDYDDGKMESDHINAWLDASVTGEVIDSGMFTIPFAWLDNDSPIEEMWKIAAAAGGRFYFDRGGTARYERLDHWLYSPHSVSQMTFSRGSGPNGYTSLTLKYDDRELYKSVVVNYTARKIDPSTTVWEPDEPIIVPAGETIAISAPFSSPIYTAPVISYKATTAGGISIQSDVTVSGTPPTGYTVADNAASSIIAITNANATEAATLRQFKITAEPVTSDNAEEKQFVSSESFWSTHTAKGKRIRGNSYVQTSHQAQALASFAGNRFDTPRLFYSLKGCPGDPSLNLGDRITVSDSIAITTDRDAFITGFSWRYSGAFSQDIEAIDAEQIYPYGTANGYFVLDDATTGTISVGGTAPTASRRVFF